MKTLLFFLSLCFPILGQAQATLVPLLKNFSRWQISGGEMGGLFSQGISHNLNYSIDKDTVIDGKSYFFLIQRYSTRDICDQAMCPSVTIGKSGTDTLLVRQFANTMITSDNDTLFSFSGTEVGDSVKLSYKYSKLWPSVQSIYLKITKVELVNIGSEKMKLFSFGHKSLELTFFYLDGVGFSEGGPLPESSYYELAEKSARLTCYQFGNSNYTTSWNPVAVTPSSNACSIILSSYEEERMSSIKIYVSESNELVHDVVASQVEIVNGMGQHVLSNQNVFKTDLSHLASGVYVAKLMIGAQTKSYRFMIR